MSCDPRFPRSGGPPTRLRARLRAVELAALAIAVASAGCYHEHRAGHDASIDGGRLSRDAARDVSWVTVCGGDRCIPRGGVGDPCTQHPCSTPTLCVGDRLVCDAPLGDAVGRWVELTECARIGAAEGCGPGRYCASLEACDLQTFSWFSREVHGAWAPLRGEGEPCDGDLGRAADLCLPCAPGLACAGGLCRRGCASDAECVSGACTDGQCAVACLPNQATCAEGSGDAPCCDPEATCQGVLRGSHLERMAPVTWVCGRVPGTACDTDDQCGSRMCVDHVCVRCTTIEGIVTDRACCEPLEEQLVDGGRVCVQPCPRSDAGEICATVDGLAIRWTCGRFAGDVCIAPSGLVCGVE